MKKNIYHESDSPSEDQDTEMRMFHETPKKEAKYPNDDHSRFAGEDYKETSHFEIGQEDPGIQRPAVPYQFSVDRQHAGKGPRGYTKRDQAILEEICEELTRDSHIDASQLSVQVVDGVVILSGEIESLEAKDRIMGIVSEVHGISQFVNEMRVSDAYSGPEAVTQKDLGVGEDYGLH